MTNPKSALWTPCTWHGENAYRSIRGEIHAIVSLQRARLVYFGSSDGKRNLMATPDRRILPNENEPSPDWGGHRFWLGPQKNWGWPPLADWEYSSVQSCMPHDESLQLQGPHANVAYPQIRRRYHWHDNELHCSCEWQSNDTPYYGMHVLAITPIDSLKLYIQISNTTPAGYLRIHLDGTDPTPLSTIETRDGTATLHSSDGQADGIKVGFPIQTIAHQSKHGTLRMSPAKTKGVVTSEVDCGYRSQIWCRDTGPFSEIEQISPYLKAPRGDWISCSIALSANIATP